MTTLTKREQWEHDLAKWCKDDRAADLERVPQATPEAVRKGHDFKLVMKENGMPYAGTSHWKCPICGSNILNLFGYAMKHWLRHTLEERQAAVKTALTQAAQEEHDRDKACEHCGSTNKNLMDATWRWAGDHWQHRCAGVHPQVGHWAVDPSDEVDRLRVLLETYKELTEQ